MSAIRLLQQVGEDEELLVGAALAPGVPDAEDHDVEGRDGQEEFEQGHHQAASV
jgi:hypothetical protein